MSTLLYVSSSIFSEHGQSSALAAHFIEQAKAADPELVVVERDLAKNPIPHLDAARVTAMMTPEADRTEEQAAVVAESDALIAELQAADQIIIGLPMYNFGVPSQLKAWTDHIARAGVTFRYTENGPVGLLDNKPVTLLAARGGLYKDQGADFQVPYFKQLLGFIGYTDVEVVFAEGLNMGDDAKASALSAAKDAINAQLS